MPDHPSWPAELVEKGARALAKARTGFGWGVINDQARSDFQREAQAVLSALSGDLVPREEHEAEVERLREQNKAAAEKRDRDEADLRARCARYENTWSSARESVKSIPADWTTDPPSQEEHGLWRYSSENSRQALTFLMGQADALAEALEPFVDRAGAAHPDFTIEEIQAGEQALALHRSSSSTETGE